MGNTRKKRGQTASRRQAEHPGLRHVNMNNKENQQEEKAQGVTSANMQYPSIMMSREKKNHCACSDMVRWRSDKMYVV